MTRLPARFLALVAIAFLVTAAIVARHQVPVALHGTSTTGTVVENRASSDGEGDITPLVEFRAHDRTVRFEGSVSHRPAQYDVGDRVPVRYETAHPRNARIDRFIELWLLPLVFGGVALAAGLGSLLLARALTGTAQPFARARDLAWWQANGTRLDARVSEISVNRSLNVGDRNPFRVVATASDPMTGAPRSFRSTNLWLDLAHVQVGDPVAVYVARNGRRSWVDGASLAGGPGQASGATTSTVTVAE